MNDEWAPRMHAIILAAGQGTRLGRRLPKCLVEVGGRPLIHHQLEALAQAGVDDVSVVVGFRADDVIRALPLGTRVVVNPDFATTNSLYSFMLGRDRVTGPALVVNADVLFHPVIARALARWPASTIAYDSRSGTDPEEMKLDIRDGALWRMSKTLPADRSHGENLGVLSLSAEAANAAFAAAEALVAQGRRRDWLASAINIAAKFHRLHCLDVAGLPWVEIDFPEDLARAREHVLPAIRSTAAVAPAVRAASAA